METRTTRQRNVHRSFTSSSDHFSDNHLLDHQFDLPISSSSRRGREDSRDRRRRGGGGGSGDYVTLFGVTAFILAVYFFVRYVDYKLPVPLTVHDIQDNPNSFIEERAANDLVTLTSVGPRVAGSHENDVITVDALTRMIQEIERSAKKGVHDIVWDIQKPRGSFHMGFQDGMTSSYSGIPNIIVKFSPKSQQAASNDSVLVNCHFDTVPGSPGASDDMISCTVMLEVLRVLSRQTTALRNPVIFLFNGAEENILQGSHGFVKGRTEDDDGDEGHPWAKNLKVFINLEGAGIGAREILFQTGPGNSWLLDSYRKVPYPWGSVVGEEIFQSGLIPSDTDFRIFRDFAHIPGLDMAFVKNGYFYHTKFDSVGHVTRGSLQHEGSNVLSLVQSLGNVDFSTVEFSKSRTVFFDMFGFFMVVYSESAAIILNLILGFVVLAIGYKELDSQPRAMVWHVMSTFAAWISGILLSLVVGLLLNVFKIYSPFHSYPMFVYLIFGIPCIVGQVLMFSRLLRGSEDLTWISGKITLAICLLLSTCFTRIVFTLTFNLLFGIVGWYSSRILFRSAAYRLYFYLIVGETFPLALSVYLTNGCLDTFVPIMGRAGSEANPNVFLAVLTALTLTLPTVSGVVPIFVFLKKPFLKCCGAVSLIVLLVILFVIGRIPYGKDTPMRIHLLEVDRSYYASDDLNTVVKRDAGFWLFNVDPNIPMFYDVLGEDIPELKHKNHVEIDAFKCEDLYCGLPFPLPVKKLVRNTHWIPKETFLPDSVTQRIRMDVIEDQKSSDGTLRQLTLSFIGPDHISINLSPGEAYNISSWSLTEEVPFPMSLRWKGRPTYFVYHARGINFERFNVTLGLRRSSPASEDNEKGTLLDINFSSFYLHGEDMKSQDLKDLIAKLPSWTYSLGFSAVSHVYSIPE